MLSFAAKKWIKILWAISLFGLLFSPLNSAESHNSALVSILPEIEAWKLTEAPQNYFPETLYEYINGAAEIYLSYDFKELIVAQYGKEDSEVNVTVEIYDMGTGKNSFGIYSAERFPESQFIPTGIQGYIEEGVLNFLVNRYYVKLLCFDCEKPSEKSLKLFSQSIVEKIRDKGLFPQVLDVFPQEGIIPYTEKFILNNFMGYGFFHDGYLVSYELEDLEFDCFLIEGKDRQDAQSMLKQYIRAKNRETVEEVPKGYLVKDRYYHNIYLAQVRNYICGVMKIKEGFEKIGEKYLGILIQNLEE